MLQDMTLWQLAIFFVTALVAVGVGTAVLFFALRVLLASMMSSPVAATIVALAIFLILFVAILMSTGDGASIELGNFRYELPVLG